VAAASPPPSRPSVVEPPGFVLFAGIVMFLNGTLSALWGLTAILNDEVLTVGGQGGVVIWDFTAWGWIVLLFGVLVATVGVGLLAGRTAARWIAVVLVTLHALAYFATISAFPLWATLVIALDVVILYHLLARWPEQA
jgi:hypothetical protein